MSVDYFLYNHQIQQTELNIISFRDLQNKYSLQIDRSKPIIIANYINHIKSFDYLQKSLKTNSIKKDKTEIKSQRTPHLLLSQYLELYKYNIDEMEILCRNSSIFLMIERAVIGQELKYQLNLNIKMDDLLSATQSSGYHEIQNYEGLETLGDSVLKFVVSQYLYIIKQLQNEDKMTKYKIKYINNKYLSVLAFLNNIQYFIRQYKKKSQDWTPPFFKNPKNEPTQIEAKNLADVLEALLGATFCYQFNFKDATKLLKNLNFPFSNQEFDLILQQEEFNNSKNYFLIEQNNTLFNQIQFDMSFFQLFILTDIYQNQSESLMKFIYQKQEISELEKTVGFQFQNKEAINQAFTIQSIGNQQNFQAIEFFGDAVIEIFAIGNFYNLNPQASPNTFQKLKKYFLSNNFMGRMALILNLQNYILDENDDNIQEIQKFISIIKQEQLDNQPFSKQNRQDGQPPKILADLWESLIAAIFKDSGWRGLQQIIGKIMQPYIIFFHKYQERIQNSQSEILFIYVQKNLQQSVQFNSYEEKGKYYCDILINGLKKFNQSGYNKKDAKDKVVEEACLYYQLLT